MLKDYTYVSYNYIYIGIGSWVSGRKIDYARLRMLLQMKLSQVCQVIALGPWILIFRGNIVSWFTMSPLSQTGLLCSSSDFVTISLICHDNQMK